MKSGILDATGIEIKIGDTLVFPYIDPMGGTHKDTPDFKAIVEFKHGCFGYQTKTRFVPLMDWSERKSGDYIPNEGNEEIITDKYLFWIDV